MNSFEINDKKLSKTFLLKIEQMNFNDNSFIISTICAINELNNQCKYKAKISDQNNSKLQINSKNNKFEIMPLHCGTKKVSSFIILDGLFEILDYGNVIYNKKKMNYLIMKNNEEILIFSTDLSLLNTQSYKNLKNMFV
jgi:hypothetical protein